MEKEAIEKKRKSKSGEFSRGFALPFRGLALIFQHFSLIRLAILPAIINIAVFALLYGVGMYFFGNYISRVIPPDVSWYWEFLYELLYVLKIIFALLAYLIVCFLLFSTIGGILASPFLDMLSERAEFIILKRKEETPFSLKLLLLDIVVVLAQESKKFFIWLAFTLITLPLMLIPAIGQVLFFIPNATLAAYFLGLGFIDFSVSRRRLDTKARKAFNKKNRWMILGMGTAVYVTILIPFLGFICLPICTVGGTLLFCEEATEEELKFRRPDLERKQKQLEKK